MARIAKPVLGLLIVALAAGCGGSKSTSTTTASTPGTTTPATTAVTGTLAAVSTGFTQAQWTQYKKDAAAFKQINTSTLAKVATCAHTVGQKKAGATEVCVGDSLNQLAAATKTLGSDLAGYANSVSGSCQSALAALINYVVPYQASIAALQNTIDTQYAAAVNGSVSSIQVAKSGGQEKNVAVAKACAPA